MKHVHNALAARVSQLDIEMSKLAEDINSAHRTLEIQQNTLMEKAEEMVELKEAIAKLETDQANASAATDGVK